MRFLSTRAKVNKITNALFSHWITAAAESANINTTTASCNEKCGNVSIPYPFGIRSSCFMEGFNLTCKKNSLQLQADIGVHSKYLVNVTGISLTKGQAIFHIPVSYNCYDSTKKQAVKKSQPYFNLRSSFRLSDTENRFTATGCDNVGYMNAQNNFTVIGGCISICQNLAEAQDGVCNGMGCCQTSFQKGIQFYSIHFKLFDNNAVRNFNPCQAAFVVAQDQFQFSSANITSKVFLQNTSKRLLELPVVVDWAIRSTKYTCKELAQSSSKTYACRSNLSVCLDSSNGPGYICNCSSGYEGNPYLDDGCQDIDECTQPEKYTCTDGTCKNSPGSYECPCLAGRHGDGKKGTCTLDQNLGPQDQNNILKILLGTILTLFLMIIISIWMYLAFQKRKLIKLKMKFYEQNGGFLLQEQLSSHQGATLKIFTIKELEKATNKFDETNILGRGGHGIVYKGILDDQTEVAIKRSKLIEYEKQSKEFAREMVILSMINHKNIVKILGCCLEVELPMLVYEFIPKGTVEEFLHSRNNISLNARLWIAAESADALAYLHSSASPPIIHGDVKSSNILLDITYTAKVSDFGASKLAPGDGNQLATFVRGTIGYLDPEYMQTQLLTAKSDVYSFGVVLVELLTRREIIYNEGSEKKTLISAFASALKEKRLHDVIDEQILGEEDLQLIEEVAAIATRCLNIRGEERPYMKQVAEDLRKLVKDHKEHPWPTKQEEGKDWLTDQASYGNPSSSLGTSSNFFSSNNTDNSLETEEMRLRGN